VLKDRGQALIEEELHAQVVRLDDEGVPPQVRAPVPHYLNESNQLAFVGGKLGVVRCKLAAEVGNQFVTLMEHAADARARRVALDDEVFVEVRELQDGH
jgi:hypothetical protein